MTKKDKAVSASVAAPVANAKAGINCFPKTKLRNQLDKLAEQRGAADTATTASDNISFAIVELAEMYAIDAALVTDDVTTVLGDWRTNMNSLTMEMAVNGHKFAKLTPAKDDKAATAALTSTGNNVMSIAKGVVDFSLALDSIETDAESDVSYRDVRKAVQGLRKARKDAANPVAAALALAESDCREAFQELATIVFDQKDIVLTQSLTAALSELAATETAAIVAAEALTAKAADDAKVAATEALAADVAADQAAEAEAA